MCAEKISARYDVSNVIASTGPDLCWTPVGNDMEKVAYSSIAFMDTSERTSGSVRNNGNYDFQLNARCSTSQGHLPGVGKGVVVEGYEGMALVETAADFLYSEGFATCSHGDPAWINRPDEGGVEAKKGKSGVSI